MESWAVVVGIVALTYAVANYLDGDVRKGPIDDKVRTIMRRVYAFLDLHKVAVTTLARIMQRI
jgi:hypothetical protein